MFTSLLLVQRIERAYCYEWFDVCTRIIMMLFIEGDTRNSPLSFHHEIGRLLYIMFEGDVGE
jgi:hypothetical protein